MTKNNAASSVPARCSPSITYNHSIIPPKSLPAQHHWPFHLLSLLWLTWMTLIGSPVSLANCSRMCLVGLGVWLNAFFSISSCLAFIVVLGPLRFDPLPPSSGLLFSPESLQSGSPSNDPWNKSKLVLILFPDGAKISIEPTWSESSWPVLLSVLILCTDKSDCPSGVPESGPFVNGPRPKGGPLMCASSSSSSSDADPINDSAKEEEMDVSVSLQFKSSGNKVRYSLRDLEVVVASLTVSVVEKKNRSPADRWRE